MMLALALRWPDWLTPGWDNWDTDTWALWVTAFATVAAGAAASVALLFARRAWKVSVAQHAIEAELRDLESRRDKRIEEMDRRAQAALVAAWCTYERFASEDIAEFGAPGDPETRIATYWLRNASNVPVYEVVVTFQVSWHESFGPIRASFVRVLPPSVEPHRWRLTRSYEGSDPIIGDPAQLPSFAIDMSFTDAAGVKWHRDANGMLTEVLAHENDTAV